MVSVDRYSVLDIDGKYLFLILMPSSLGMHRISGRIIRPFLISGIRPDTKLVSRISGQISGKAGYRISG
jgi:hypothetical protein